MDELLPQNRTARFAAIAAAVAWLLLGFYLAFLHDKAPGALSPIAQAAERTQSSPGYKVAIESTAEGGPLGSMRLEGSGAYNGSTDRFQLEIHSSGTAGPAFTMEQVGEGLTFYMRSPFLAGVGGGAEWMKLDLSDVVQGGTDMSPHGQLDQLKGIAQDVQKVGPEKVRGEPTTHYRAYIDLGDRVEQLRDQGEGDAAGALEAALGSTQNPLVPVDVWIGDDGYVHRQTTTMPWAVGGTSALTMTMEFYGFGAAPEIALPPESEVFDATGLAEDLLSAGG